VLGQGRHRPQDIGSGRILQEISVRTGFDGARDVHFVGMHAQDEDAYRWKSADDLLNGIDAAELRHGEVQDDHIRLQFERLPHGLTPVPCLSDHVPTRLRLENLAQTLTYDRVIVAEENPYSRHVMPSRQAGARW